MCTSSSSAVFVCWSGSDLATPRFFAAVSFRWTEIDIHVLHPFWDVLLNIDLIIKYPDLMCSESLLRSSRLQARTHYFWQMKWSGTVPCRFPWFNQFLWERSRDKSLRHCLWCYLEPCIPLPSAETSNLSDCPLLIERWCPRTISCLSSRETSTVSRSDTRRCWDFIWRCIHLRTLLCRTQVHDTYSNINDPREVVKNPVTEKTCVPSNFLEERNFHRREHERDRTRKL